MEDEFLLKLIRRNISKFKTSSNPSIASYLQDKALSLNKQNSIRTYLLIDSDTSELIGYFCLKIVIIKFEINVSKNIKKKISSDAMKNNEFPSLLITKLARNDQYKGLVSGKTILEYAFSIAYDIYKKTALKHVCVDWYDHFKLEKFYCEDCGFKIFQYRNTDKGKIVSAFYKF
ncbi:MULTISPECIES: hypothetical protein [Staphylococcus]|nr:MULTISPECIES: hypothetical protein [Staphylococcus]MDU0438672.1 hypothetical protein [Staphylococcus haemolyticus]MDU0441158.1 hypothetical protein [Staphylococcus haemolyticus]MDU0473258.1 hypothetical protein [Staphylococcus haemolyticus]MDU0484778.1 hypothetical protein [Staphylococcus haemolyticus]MDU0489473.1 hypothetical protein [Staphylococcus haemolyticus]